MKNFKRFASVVMVIMMMLSMMLPAMAHTITVNGAVDGQVYSIYKLLDLSYANDAYYYTVNEDWKEFFAQDTIKGVYVNIGAAEDVTWVTDADVQEFAQLALAYAEANNITKAADDVTASSGATFTVTTAGYYLVSTSLGALVAIDTVSDTDITVFEKNDYPTLNKEVQEDSTENWGEAATADRGQEVNFRLTVTIPNNDAYTYPDKDVNNSGIGNGVDKDFVITDTLPEGMTYKTGSAKIGTESITPVENGNVLTFTITKDQLTKTTDDVVTVVIEYIAIVDGDADHDTPLTNTAYLTYGTYVTPDVSASVETYFIEIFKHTSDNAPLAGAGFILKNLTTGKFYSVAEDGVVTWVEEEEDATEKITPADGIIKFEGLDADKYEIIEKTVPAGYNPLVTNPTAEIVDASLTDITQIDVLNQSGTELPSTGGIGTTIFYCAGAILALGAFVLLVTKKRMSREG